MLERLELTWIEILERSLPHWLLSTEESGADSSGYALIPSGWLLEAADAPPYSRLEFHVPWAKLFDPRTTVHVLRLLGPRKPLLRVTLTWGPDESRPWGYRVEHVDASTDKELGLVDHTELAPAIVLGVEGRARPQCWFRVTKERLEGPTEEGHCLCRCRL